HYPILRQLKEVGYDGVEIPIFKRDDAAFGELKRALNDVGLEATAVTVAAPEANPIDPDPAGRRAAVETPSRPAHSAAVLGAQTLCGPIRSPVGCRVGRGRTEEEWGWAVETLRQVAERSEVTLGVEALNRFETYFLNTAADTRRLVDDVGHP